MLDLLTNVYNSTGHSDGTNNLATYTTFGALFGAFGNLLAAVGFSLAIIGCGYGCILMVQSNGDPKAAYKAWWYIIYSMIGGLISLGLFALKGVIIQLTGTTDANYTNNLPNF